MLSPTIEVTVLLTKQIPDAGCQRPSAKIWPKYFSTIRPAVYGRKVLALPETCTEIRNVLMAKILLVDDNEFTRLIIKGILESDGHTLIVAKNGQDGVEALRNTAGIDLVIMDIVMPVMNGFEAVKLVRADPAITHIPILAVTARDTSGDYEDIYDAGCDAYVSKPVEAHRLLDRVNSLLN
tara:strand:- start:66 stop:608 length:543 start_codon:yes stop_codon:yes gene_type:complete